MRTFVGAAALLLLFPLLAVVLAAPLPSGRSQSTTYQHPTLAPTDRARPSTTPPAFAIVTVLDDADPDPGVLFGVVALGGSLRRFRAAHSPVALVALVRTHPHSNNPNNPNNPNPNPNLGMLARAGWEVVSVEDPAQRASYWTATGSHAGGSGRGAWST